MHERLKLYLVEHLNKGVDLYLLASELVDLRTGWGPRLRMDQVEDEIETMQRLTRLLGEIREGIKETGLYLRG